MLPRPAPAAPPPVPYSPPGHAAAAGVKDLADRVKSNADKVKKNLRDVPLSDATKKQLSDGLDKVSGGAGKVSGVAGSVDRAIGAIDQNLKETEGLGMPDKARDFLAWWKGLWSAGGDVGQVYVDGQISGLPKGAQDKIKEALPIKEFAQEMGQLPTTGARSIRGGKQGEDQRAQNRDIFDDLEPNTWGR